MSGFTWRDGPRTIRFGRGLRAGFSRHLEPGYALLWSRHGQRAVPELAETAGAVHEVPPGFVDQVAAPLVDQVDASLIVAVGGGRVIDTAKAVAAARGGEVAAMPTTLSAAEMTWVHRFASGFEERSSFTRPSLVLNDPALSASQDPQGLAVLTRDVVNTADRRPAPDP